METKQIDWTLRNVGIMKASVLNHILKQFEDAPGATVDLSHSVIRVLAPNQHVVLSAARISHNDWHVRAVKNLLIAETSES